MYTMKKLQNEPFTFKWSVNGNYPANTGYFKVIVFMMPQKQPRVHIHKFSLQQISFHFEIIRNVPYNSTANQNIDLLHALVLMDQERNDIQS